MIARLDLLMCRLGGHRWTRPFAVQQPACRVVSRYCTRCDETKHAVQDVWDEPTRAFALAVNSWLEQTAAHQDGAA